MLFTFAFILSYDTLVLIILTYPHFLFISISLLFLIHLITQFSISFSIIHQFFICLPFYSVFFPICICIPFCIPYQMYPLPHIISSIRSNKGINS